MKNTIYRPIILAFILFVGISLRANINLEYNEYTRGSGSNLLDEAIFQVASLTTDRITGEELQKKAVGLAVNDDNAARSTYSDIVRSNRKKIKEAQILFDGATRSYEGGNNEKAQDYYNKAMEKLMSVRLAPEMNYGLKDDFANIFDKLEQMLGSLERDLDKQYTIPMDTDNELVQKYLDRYTKEGGAKENIKKALKRSGKYREMILKYLREYDLPEELVYLPVVESLYNNNDRSWAGALGLWQLMSHRARHLGLKVNYWVDERKDPEKATKAACKYLKELYIMFDDWHLALSAYNRGEYGLARDLKFSKATNIEQISKRKAVPRETELFVPQFIAVTLIANEPAKYGYELEFDKPLRYETIRIDDVIDLKVAAECAGTSVSELKSLNPAIKAWCTPQNYTGFELRLPMGSKETFLTNLMNVDDLNPSRGFIKYKVVKGDYLGKIARKFGTSVRMIKEDNKIRNDRALRVNQVLVIRPGKSYKWSD